MAEAMLVILMSADGEEPWYPVLPEKVPEWLKHPDVMANLVHGEMAQQAGGLTWYRAEKVSSEGEIKH
jgi:hypothetical protein